MSLTHALQPAEHARGPHSTALVGPSADADTSALHRNDCFTEIQRAASAVTSSRKPCITPSYREGFSPRKASSATLCLRAKDYL